MITLQELLNAIKLANPTQKQFLILFVGVNENYYSIHIGDEDLRNSKAVDIIRQAFPFCFNILDIDVSIESISNSEIKTTTIARINAECSKIIPEIYFKMIVNGDKSDSINEWNAYNMASILFTYFHSNQIEEFNSTWENMYTNWKRFGVKKI